MIFRRVIGPEGLHSLDDLARLGPAVRKIAAHDLGLFLVPTGANAKEKAALGKIVERGNLFGQE